MKDIIYAGFAQLSYLNWHNSGREINKKIIRLEGKKLIDIFKDRESFEILKNSDYAKIYEDGKDFLREENIRNGVVAKIYDIVPALNVVTVLTTFPALS